VLYYVRTYSSFWVTGYCASTEVVKVKGKEPAEDSKKPNDPSKQPPQTFALVNDRSDDDFFKGFEKRKQDEKIEELKTQLEALTTVVEDQKKQLKEAIYTINVLKTVNILEEKPIEGQKLFSSLENRIKTIALEGLKDKEGFQKDQ